VGRSEKPERVPSRETENSSIFASIERLRNPAANEPLTDCGIALKLRTSRHSVKVVLEMEAKDTTLPPVGVP